MAASEAITIVLLGTVVVCGYLVLVLNSSDTTGYVALIATPLVTAIVGIILSARLQHVAKAVARVETATDGVATAAFSLISDKLDAAVVDRTDVEHRQTTEAERIARDGPELLPPPRAA